MTYYDQIAEGYTRLYGDEQRGKYRTAFDAVDWSHADQVIDVGCGTGLFMKMVAVKVQRVVGVDSSKEMVKKANCLKIENAHLVLCDADHLPFRGKTFDAAVAFTLLQNVVDPSVTIRRLTSTLKPHSWVVLTTLKREGSREAFVNLIRDSGLLVMRIVDEEKVKDFVVIASLN